jgi:hypothetical protein
MFETDKETAKQYPILQIMIDRYLPLLIYNDEVKTAFISNLDKKMAPAEFDDMVKSGKGFNIVVTDGSSEFKDFEKNTIYITRHLVESAQSELIKTRKSKDGLELMVAMFNLSVSILHEASHGKAFKFGLKDVGQGTAFFDYERGFSFEEMLFGRNSTSSIQRNVGMKVRDYDKFRQLALKTYGKTKAFGLTITGRDMDYEGRKLQIPMSTESRKPKKNTK